MKLKGMLTVIIGLLFLVSCAKVQKADHTAGSEVYHTEEQLQETTEQKIMEMEQETIEQAAMEQETTEQENVTDLTDETMTVFFARLFCIKLQKVFAGCCTYIL